MKSQDIRQIWTSFFESKQHLKVPSSSLVPQNPTLLLTNAGMVPFVPYFLGQEKPPQNRITSIQKCVRVGGKDSDLENIGKTPRHLTFFEMLGNFSFGDYFKEEVIPWSWELLTEGYGFKPEELQVSVFEGDSEVGFDQEAYDIWHEKVGLPEKQIIKLGRADNFWGPPGGVSGPCGPCSEIYYVPKDGSEPIEIWNLVFMQYEKFEDGSLKVLPKPNVDTGAGLERLASILQKKETVFETDLLEPIVEKIKTFSLDETSPKLTLALKIIADHIRCSSLLLTDGVKPSNMGRGYILRMLIRRAARYGWLIGLKQPFLFELVTSCSEIFKNEYPQLLEKLASIQNQIKEEEEAFHKTLEKGLVEFQGLVSKVQNSVIPGEQAFDLYATFGFPLELTVDLAEEKNLSVDLKSYEEAKEKHSQVSNKGKFSVGLKSQFDAEINELAATEFKGYEKLELQDCKVLLSEKISSEDEFVNAVVILDQTPFYAESGGQLADKGEIIGSLSPQIVFQVNDVQKQGKVFLHKGIFRGKEEFSKDDLVIAKVNVSRREEIKKHHTATHLLQSALRLVLGQEVQQAGSQVDSNRLRFDFTFGKALTAKQMQEVENIINNWVKEDLKTETRNLPYDEAIKEGALAFFGDKYDDEVRVLSIGNTKAISVELCGGTH
ncbi:MAG TPA: alanine--tRNA ligase, partial [Vampirovibrionales bacterium]